MNAANMTFSNADRTRCCRRGTFVIQARGAFRNSVTSCIQTKSATKCRSRSRGVYLVKGQVQLSLEQLVIILTIMNKTFVLSKFGKMSIEVLPVFSCLFFFWSSCLPFSVSAFLPTCLSIYQSMPCLCVYVCMCVCECVCARVCVLVSARVRVS